MTTSLHDLPAELLHRIVKQFKYDTLTLRNLCLTSKWFIHVARLHLYDHIRVVEYNSYLRTRTCIDQRRSQKFFATLVDHNPCLAKHVRCFVYEAWFPTDVDIQDVLLRGLRLMTNIQILELTPVGGLHVPTNIFQGCTFQLTHFHCNFRCSIEFLSSQLALQSLRLESDIGTLPPDCCPSLKSLKVGENIWKLLPGHSIRHLEFFVFEYIESFSGVATELRNITSLVFLYSLSLYAPRTPELEPMVPYLTELRVLRIICTPQFHVADGLYVAPEAILGLRNLEILIYSKPELFTLDGYNPGKHPQMVNLWFQNMPNFKAAYFERTFQPTTQKKYERWLANETTPTWVGHDEVLWGHGFYSSYAEEYELSLAPY